MNININIINKTKIGRNIKEGIPTKLHVLQLKTILDYKIGTQ